MADVSRRGPCTDGPTTEGDDRGQLFVLTALTLAVLFVALALVLNTAIYTENLATRSRDPGASDALRYQTDVVDGAARLIGPTNREYTDDSTLSGLRTDYEEQLTAYERQRNHHALFASHRVDVSVTGVTGGTRVEQTALRDFTDVDGDTPFTLDDTISTVRVFKLTVEDTTNLVDSSGPAPSDAFTVSATDGTDTWSMDVYDDSGVITLEFHDGTTCSVGSSVTIDVTGSLSGCPFPALSSTLSSPYSIQYSDATNVYGTYTLVIDPPRGDVYSSDKYADTPSSTAPFAIDTIWSATLNMTYRGPGVTIGTDATVTPGDAG